MQPDIDFRKEEKMSPRSKREYIEAVHRRYKDASRSERTIMLNELCATCGYHRKYAIRLLKGFKRFTKPKPRKRGKPSFYNREEILTPLKRIWLEANLPCSKRLKAIPPLWLPGYNQCFGELPTEVNHALLAISPATIDRLLKPVRIQYQKRGRSTTKPGTLLKNRIPIQTSQWDESRPGFIEADTVPIAAIPSPVSSSIPSISPPVGPNKETSGEKVKPVSSSNSKISKTPSLFPC